MSLFLSRLHHLRPSLPFNRTPPCAASNYRILSATTTQASAPNPHFAVDYLIQSCGISPDDAIRVAKKIQHLKSPDKPDSMLQFLRQVGINESDIRAAVLRDPRLLCSNVEKSLIPNIAKLQELGLLMEDISGIMTVCPSLFLFNIVPKVDFWMRALGSAEDVIYILTRRPTLICSNLEKVIIPNLSFLREKCGLSVRQIVQLIMMSPRLVISKPASLEIKAQMAEKLGLERGKPMFMYALAATCSLNERTIDAKILHLRSLGLSCEEVRWMISKYPQILTKSTELIGRKMEFLLKEAGCDKLDVVRNPNLLIYNLEKRMIPRSIVRKLLKSERLPVANNAFVTFMRPNEKMFLDKFVLPYEHAIPGIYRAYADACAGKIGAVEIVQV